MIQSLVEFGVANVKVWLDPAGGERICKYQVDGGFEPESRHEWGKIANRGTVLDIGAYSGLYSIAAVKLGAARVIAFEPMPIMFKRLCENLEHNGLVDEVEVEDAAVSERCGTAELQFTPAIAMTAGASLTATSSAHPQSLTVRTVSIDSLWLSDVTAIKMDVGGHEPDVIRGALKTIEKWRPRIIAECWAEELEKQIMMLLPGYRCTAVLDGRNLFLEPKIMSERKPFDGEVVVCLEDKFYHGGVEALVMRPMSLSMVEPIGVA